MSCRFGKQTEYGNRKGFWLKTLLVSSASLLVMGTSSWAQVSITRGPTPIPAGEAIGAQDLTVRNNHLAVTFGVDTPGPWGVPSGGILDGAVVRNGKIEMDHIALMDFIPNNWSSWPNTYQNIEVVKDSPEEAVIRVTRDWEKTSIQTVYTLKAGATRIQARTIFKNLDTRDYDDLLSGYVLWPEGGYIFQPPGMEGIKKGSSKGKALADWMVNYDENWAIGLHAPYFDFINYDSRDMYVGHSLKKGSRKEFAGWVEINPEGDIASFVKFESERKGRETGILAGEAFTEDGKPMDAPVVIIEKDGKPYSWTIGKNGRYSLELPKGKYTAYAAGKSYGASSKKTVKVKAGKTTSRDFSDMKYPAEVTFDVVEAATGMPIDARITIEDGQAPLVKFLGQKTFFTELGNVGKLTVPMGPGKYVFKVASGESFLSTATTVESEMASGEKKTLPAAIATVVDPAARNWFSADMHHHSDLVDSVTPAEYLVRSQLAARLNFTLVSDHDLLDNNYPVMELSKTRGFKFISSVELSPDWSHFGASPINLGEKLRVNPATVPVDELFAEARRMGARIVTANHPYIPYGYFYAVDNGKAPGGFDPTFDLVEMNSVGYPEKTVARMHELWAAGQKYYLSAGTDTHDVWSEVSGRIRMFAHLNGEETPDAFVNALKEGRSYASNGPLFYPEVMFGTTRKVRPNEPVAIHLTAQSVNGLKEIRLMSGNKVIDSVTFEGGPVTRDVSFELKTKEDTYYAIVAVDAKGLKAWSNPVWIDVVSYLKTSEAVSKIKN